MLLEDSADNQLQCQNLFNQLVAQSQQNTESHGLSQVIDVVGEQELSAYSREEDFNGSFRDEDFVSASIDQNISQANYYSQVSQFED